MYAMFVSLQKSQTNGLRATWDACLVASPATTVQSHPDPRPPVFSILSLQFHGAHLDCSLVGFREVEYHS